MAKTRERAKFGYLNYADIQARIKEGKLDQYDVVYCKDRKNQYLIDGDLNLIELRSRIYIYSSEEEAIDELNKNTDTYVGQLVSILNGEVYSGYIVNKNLDEKYYVIPLYKNPHGINYNELNNIPIINMEGNSDNPIIVSGLYDGTYMVKGVYTTPENEKITTLIGHYISVATINGSKYITRIQSDKIFKSIITNDNISSEEYITDQFLKAQNYIPVDELDSKVSALGFTKKTEMENHVSSLVHNIVEEKIDEALEEKLLSISDEEINTFFSKNSDKQ